MGGLQHTSMKHLGKSTEKKAFQADDPNTRVDRTIHAPDSAHYQTVL
jgi:hypothetical protein